MSNHAENEKKPIYKKWWFWLIIIVVIVGIGGSGTNTNNSTNVIETSMETTEKQTTTEEQSNQSIEYTAKTVDELKEDLKNNAATAKEKYNGKYLELKGRLGTIDADLKYISLLSANDKFDFTGIHCTIKNEEQKNVIKTLNKDDTIIVKGKITNVGEVLGYYLDITEVAK